MAAEKKAAKAAPKPVAKKKAEPKPVAKAKPAPKPATPVVEEETVEIIGVTPVAGRDKPIEIEPLGSGTVQIRTNGWVRLDRVAFSQFEKAVRRARQS